MIFSVEIDCIALEFKVRETNEAHKLPIEFFRTANQAKKRYVNRLSREPRQ